MAQETASTRSSKTQNRMEELKKLSEEIRGDLRRATSELKDEWKELERRLPDPSAAIRGATAEVADRLVDELRKFRTRMQQRWAAEGAGIADLMSRPAVTCLVSDSVARAVTAMWERDVGFLPVVDHDQKIAGTLTDRDAAIAACTRGQRFDEIPVDTVMGRDVVTCAPTTSAAHVLALMKEHQIRRMPVVEDRRPVGVITIHDLARLAAGSEKAGISAADVVEALATIAKPRRTNGNRAA